MIPKPRDVEALAPITEALDAADHETRLAWCRGLNGKQQYKLYELALGSPVRVDDLVSGEGVVHHHGRNGLVLFNLFEKRFARHEGAVVGYNHPVLDQGRFALVASFLRPIYLLVTGPGLYTAYDSPDVPGEVWVDYRKVSETHPESFPPRQDNEHGLPALVFGDMVDVMRRVSKHVLIGDAFKGRYPRPNKAPFLAWFGATFLPTAPFILCTEHVPGHQP